MTPASVPSTGASHPADATVDPARPLRLGLLLLAGLGTAGTALELAVLRHWGSTIQLVPWAAVIATAVAVAAMAVRPSSRTVRIVRWVAVALCLVAAFGTYEHVLSNYHAAPLDFRFATRWPTMSAPARWWAAASGAVGPSPALAPAVLAQSALCLLLACVRHPALAAKSRNGPPTRDDRSSWDRSDPASSSWEQASAG
ncbi:MAG: hypothetical protein QOG82_604 [Actinomycetota bacterium]|nr:hypothetical protein [Actinomycetota bacterium]